MDDRRNDEDDGKVVGVVEELVVLLSKIDGDINHGGQAEPRQLNERNGEVVVVNLK